MGQRTPGARLIRAPPYPGTAAPSPPRTLSPGPDSEILVLASRPPLRSIWKVPWFLGLTVSVVRQLEPSDRLVGWSLRAQPLARTFWTLSAWTDATALREFVNQTPHSAAMRKLRPHMGPMRFTSWTVHGSALPVAWDEAIVRLMGAGATSGGGAA